MAIIHSNQDGGRPGGRLIPLAVLALLAGLLPPGSAGAVDCSQSLQNQVDVAPPGSVVDVPACTYRETVFIGHAVTLDGHGLAVVDGDNVRDRWFWIGASNVTIRGFVMRNANTANQEGAIGTQPGISNIVIDHNDLGSTVGGEQVGIAGTTNSKVTNNSIHDGGQVGIGTFRNTGLLIQGNHVYHNNTAGVDPAWAAGGIKAVQDTSSHYLNNEIDHNAGPGLWCDIGCNGIVVANNYVHDQAYNPIFIEISSNAEVYGNTVSSAPVGAMDWGCIVSSSSGDVNIHDNTCTDAMFLRVQLDNRSDIPADAGHNIKLLNNRMLRTVPDANKITSWWQWSSTGPLIPGTNGNVDFGNISLSSQNTPTLVPTTTPVPTVTSVPRCAVRSTSGSMASRGDGTVIYAHCRRRS